MVGVSIKRFVKCLKLSVVKVVDSCWIFSTKWSDTFVRFLYNWKGARIWNKNIS